MMLLLSGLKRWRSWEIIKLKNIINGIALFITYGIPVLSFIWQILSDLSDNKKIETIISNYNYQNNSDINIGDVNIQNGYIQINNSQTINNTDLKNELEKFENEKLEDKKFLSDNLYSMSFIIILILFILNLIHNFYNAWDAFKNISSIWDINKDVIINNIILSFDKTLNQLLLMIFIYVLLVVFKYSLNKQSVISILGFLAVAILYLITYLGTKQGFVQSFKYPTSLSEFSVIISIIIILVVPLLLFFGLNILVKRLFNLILVYKARTKTELVNRLNSTSIVIAPILIIIVKIFLR